MTNRNVKITVPQEMQDRWQNIVDSMAELVGVPVGLIMRLVEDNIEVYKASCSKGNPYSPGAHEHLDGSGLYCETVIKTQKPLLVPDALSDPKWAHNPDVKLNMISYLGFPIMLPNKKPYGTLCILDQRPNSYSDTIYKLVDNFRCLIEQYLALLYMNRELGEQNKSLSDYIEEMHSLRGLIPICARCKKIKDSNGYWNAVENYLIKHPKANFTHGFCPDCYRKMMDDEDARP